MTRSDSLHPDLFIECKYQKGAHKVLRHLMDDAAEKAEKEKKIPILAVGFPGRPFNESLIIIRACDVDEVVDPIHLEDKDGRF